MKARALGHALLLLALGGHGPAQAADRAKPLDAELSALRLSGPTRMEELSGLAVSRTYPGIVWGHGDSGQPPVLWALDLERESASPTSPKRVTTAPAGRADPRGGQQHRLGRSHHP